MTETLRLIDSNLPDPLFMNAVPMTYGEARAWVEDHLVPVLTTDTVLEWKTSTNRRFRWVISEGRITEQNAAILWSTPRALDDETPS